MAFNHAMFKQKKKRAIDPNAPPRPNLLSHEKQMKESAGHFADLVKLVLLQQEEITQLKSKVRQIESTLSQVTSILRGKK